MGLADLWGFALHSICGCGGAEVKQKKISGLRGEKNLKGGAAWDELLQESHQRECKQDGKCCQPYAASHEQRWKVSEGLGRRLKEEEVGKNNELKHSHLCWQNNLLHHIFSQLQLFPHSCSTVIALRPGWRKQRNYFVVALFLMMCYPFVFIGHPCPGAFGHITKYN